MSRSEEKRERRLEKKRRKAEAFLAIAELNDVDKAVAKRRKLGRAARIMIGCSGGLIMTNINF
jgi:hypothetical protein